MSDSTIPSKRPHSPEPSDVTARRLSVYYCDPDGDQKISAGLEESRRVFVVCFPAMSLACRPWKAMLGKNSAFSEASSDQSEPIHFGDDNPDALLILLNAAHLRYAQVTATLEFQELYDVAVLCDKYDAAQLVQPWIKHWARHITQTSLSEVGWDRVEKSLFIAWTFGDGESFGLLSRRIIMTLQHYETGGLKIVPKGQVSEEVLPPFLYEKIVQAREEALKEALTACYDVCDLFSSGKEGLCRYGGDGRYDREERNAISSAGDLL